MGNNVLLELVDWAYSKFRDGRCGAVEIDGASSIEAGLLHL